MTALVVSAGAIFEIGCPSTLDRSTEQQLSFRTTLGGKRKAFLRRGGRRGWSIDVGLATPGEVSSIEAIARRMGPFGWYGPEALAGNLLSPQATSWDPVPASGADAGLVQLPDGTIASTISAAGTIRVGAAHGAYEMVPVRPGEAVTVGAWSLGGQWFRGFWRDATGTSITNWSDTAVTHTGWTWHEVTLSPPAGSAYIELQLAGGTQYALPSISWGQDAAREMGTGCPKAIIHGPAHAPVTITRLAHLTNSSYSITEVG